ncbi:hypothetical protein PV10_03349 [Exophiala mesophila]|uniref:Essential protein Yae1 N-terminal domain-containing protein n=1 Tax=Exophiala mesophila TaxID=212818 RepID=A0A0D1ZP15_EXOME|nr:uncharacterized protein PV10_03349 [Exophiala mesophila]KIV95729.1 hypothetical protein PV10_03349 [Exophiala mesophila]
MSADPFDQLLELEDEYYNEGYEAGVSDSRYAGMIEGRTFGIEKGFEKALELGKSHGRATLWHSRISVTRESDQSQDEQTPQSSAIATEATLLREIIQTLGNIPSNARLQRHIETLLSTSDPTMVVKDNTDEAVTDFDDRLAKANAKLKVIANIAGEPVNPTSTGNTGIEDATGLNARH